MVLKDQICVILCGGKSSRMGRNKALLPFGKHRLLGYLVEKYHRIFGQVFLCAKEEYAKSYASINAPILYEQSEIFAPMIGLHASLCQLQKKIFFTTTDCPFVQERHFCALNEAFLEHSSRITYAKTSQQSHFLIGIYLPSILPALEDLIQKEDFKMSSFIASCDGFGVNFDDEESFQNLNTPADYQNALLRIKDGK